MARVLLFLTMFLFPVYANASLVINEVMYDLKEGSDTDREWVEIYNDSTEDINISGWKFNDGSNHVLNEPPKNGGQGSMVIPANGYAILVADAVSFLSDNPGFSGTVIDTVMSLNNTSDELSLVDSLGSVANLLSYSKDQGGAGDGSTLSLIGGAWKSGKSTPGILNEELVQEIQEPSGEQNPSGGSPSSSTKTEPYVEPKITGEFVLPSRVMTGISFVIDTKIFGFSKEPINRGYFSWSFGDGSKKETEILEKVEHVYQDPGEYVIFFEYRRSPYLPEPDLLLRSTIKVTPLTVYISSLDNSGNVTIENKSSYEIDLSNWFILSNNISFRIPKNTIILPAKKIIFRNQITGIVPGSISVSLTNPSGEVISIFPEKIAVSPVLKTSTVVKNSSQKSYDVKTEEKVLNLDEILPAKPNTSFTGPSIYISLLILMILIGISLVYFIKNKKDKNETSTADDYTIIE